MTIRRWSSSVQSPRCRQDHYQPRRQGPWNPPGATGEPRDQRANGLASVSQPPVTESLAEYGQRMSCGPFHHVRLRVPVMCALRAVTCRVTTLARKSSSSPIAPTGICFELAPLGILPALPEWAAVSWRFRSPHTRGAERVLPSARIHDWALARSSRVLACGQIFVWTCTSAAGRCNEGGTDRCRAHGKCYGWSRRRRGHDLVVFNRTRSRAGNAAGGIGAQVALGRADQGRSRPRG